MEKGHFHVSGQTGTVEQKVLNIVYIVNQCQLKWLWAASTNQTWLLTANQPRVIITRSRMLRSSIFMRTCSVWKCPLRYASSWDRSKRGTPSVNSSAITQPANTKTVWETETHCSPIVGFSCYSSLNAFIFHVTANHLSKHKIKF